jgi:glyoxylase-like metal-dependent hydrolase (beta-lactamase superfamily II)
MRLIDLQHLGRERVIGCWEVDGVLIDPGPTSCLPTLLEALGDGRPRALLLTHIHLDHAGATGSLVERWPDLEVYVHEVGAPHLIDPSRLVQSAGRLYGEDMDRLWGDMVPVPEGNITVLRGDERLLDGAFEVAYTPGHASHHISFLHEGTAYVGDVAGVRIAEGLPTIPPTPPPDIDVEAWHHSIERIRAWRPERLAMTHFGGGEEVEAQLDEVSRRLDDWARRAREQDKDEFIAGVRAEILEGAGVEMLDTYTQAAPPDQLYAGLERYWRKRPDGPRGVGILKADVADH